MLIFPTSEEEPEQSEVDKLSRKASPPPSMTETGTPLTPRQLLRLMNVHHLEGLDDEQSIIRRGNSMDSDAIAHAATMFQTTQVQQLLQTPESGVVLVNGCSDRSQNTKISPITHVCATLTHALRRSVGDNIVLAFFCGQHSASDDGLVGPQGLMRSLVAFLVLSLVQNDCIVESTPIWFPDFQGDVEQLSFIDLCQVFFNLVELVPKGLTVYCVVDGISYYERDVWKGDFDLMIECFGNIITNKAIAAAPFKLLFTSPTTSHWFPDLMPHQRVSLRNTRTRGSTNAQTYLRTAFGETMSQGD